MIARNPWPSNLESGCCGADEVLIVDLYCWKTWPSAVNSRYSGHPRDRDLVSVIARVRNSGVRENFYFKSYLQKGVTCVFIFINSSTFFRPVVASKERQNFDSFKEFCRLLQNIAHPCFHTEKGGLWKT